MAFGPFKDGYKSSNQGDFLGLRAKLEGMGYGQNKKAPQKIVVKKAVAPAPPAPTESVGSIIDPAPQQPLSFDTLDPNEVDPNRTPNNYKMDTDTTTRHSGEKKIENLVYSPEEFNALYDTVANQREFQDLKESNDEYDNLLSMVSAQPSADPGWLKPLIALTDSQTGSKLMQGYTPPVSGEQKMQALLKYKDESLKRKGDLAKGILEGVSKMKLGSITNFTDSKDLMSLVMGFKPQTGYNFDQRSQLQEDRMADQAHKAIVRSIKTDPIVRNNVLQLHTLRNAYKSLTDVSKLTNQQIHEAQMVYNSALGQKLGRTGVSERDKTYFENIGWNWDGLKQFLFGKPADIKKNHPMVMQILEQYNNEFGNVNEQLSDYLNTLSEGFSNYMDNPRYADKKDAIDKLVGTLRHHSARQNPLRPAPHHQIHKNKKPAPAPAKPKGGVMSFEEWKKAKGKK